MKSYTQITRELNTETPVPVMIGKQGDTGRGIILTLTSNGQVMVPAAGEVCRLYAKKPDDTVSYIMGTVSASQILFDLTAEMQAVPGVVEVEVQVGSAGELVSTPVFNMVVYPTNIDDAAVESQDEYPIFEQAIAQLQQYDGRLLALETVDRDTQLFVANLPGVTVNAVRVGKVIFAYFYTDSIVTMPAGGEVNLFSAMAGAIPAIPARFVCFNNAASSPADLCMNGRITAAGSVYVYSYTTGTRPYGMLTYLAQ